MSTLNSTSFARTPQATDDFFSFTETDLQVRRNPHFLLLDVLANDLGGKAKTLYALDDGAGSAADTRSDLLSSDVGKPVAGTTLKGALLKIVDGQVHLDLTQALAQNPTFQSLDQMAAGDTFVDSFTYAIRMANGALSWATVTYTLTGTNDDPVVSGAVTGAVQEDGASLALSALANASDVDFGDQLSVVDVPAAEALPPGVSFDAATQRFTLDPRHSAYQSLGEGVSTTVTVSYGVSDGIATTPASVVWTVVGTNDAAVIGGDTHGRVVEDGVVTTGGLLTVDDPDAGESFFTDTSSLIGAYGTFSFDTRSGAWTYTLNNGQAHVQALVAGQVVTDTLTVRTADGSSQNIVVSIQGADEAAVGPVVVADLVHVSTDTRGIAIPVAALLANDLNADGASLALTGSTGPINHLSLTPGVAGGMLHFDFTGNGSGSGFINYSLTSGGLTSHGTVEVKPHTTNGGRNEVTLSGDYAASYLDLLANDDSALSSGSGAADIFLGGAGADRLAGGPGNDQLTGGGGSDTFVFNVAPGAADADLIMDFNADKASTERDVIELLSSVFAGVNAAAGPGSSIQASQFLSLANADSAYTSTDARIVYDQSTGKVFHDANGAVNGLLDAALFVTLNNKPIGLDASDFRVL